jgi:phosphoribosylaminoimidazole-succinocarboxamide synthase
MFKLIVFVSGNGSNLEAIIESCKLGILDATVEMVVSNRHDAYALERAKKHGIRSFVMQYSKEIYPVRAEYDERLAEFVNQYKYDLIILAGWMHIMSKSFLSNIKSPVINLHPALPGQFVGMHAIERAFEAAQRGEITKTGSMVHYVIEELDAGKVISTVEIPIRKNETLETLKNKFQYYEKFLLISSIDKLLSDMTSKLIYVGKVRNVYDAGKNLIAIEATDKQSAFDRHICEIPNKGEILTKLSEFWFKSTKHIVNNHYVSSMGNIMLCTKCTPFKVEVVVRGYITGSTSTSLWTHYSRGEREYCGIKFPDGLVKNQKLDLPVITPTTKSSSDKPVSGDDIITMNLMTKDEWLTIKAKALELFSYGQSYADKHGLILVDTKYEFGKDSDGNIMLIDELHTCDSSRYWLKVSYNERFKNQQEPDSLDKDIIRRYIASRCDPYKDKLPEIPQEHIIKTRQVYETLYNMLVGYTFVSDGNISINDVMSK